MNPRHSDPQSDALPLSYNHHKCVSAGAPRGNRTPSLWIRNPMLYPIELWALIAHGAADETRTRNPYLGRVMLYQLSYSRGTLVGATGLEPATSCTQGMRAPSCATPRHNAGYYNTEHPARQAKKTPTKKPGYPGFFAAKRVAKSLGSGGRLPRGKAPPSPKPAPLPSSTLPWHRGTSDGNGNPGVCFGRKAPLL